MIEMIEKHYDERPKEIRNNACKARMGNQQLEAQEEEMTNQNRKRRKQQEP